MSHVLLKLNLERELSGLNKEKLAIASFELFVISVFLNIIDSNDISHS